MTYYMPIILNKLVKSANFLSLYQPKLLELETLSIKENFETLLYSNKSLEVLMEIAYLVSSTQHLCHQHLDRLANGIHPSR